MAGAIIEAADHPALEKYDAACRAIAEAKAVDELKDIHDAARAMAAAARVAKNKQAEADMAAIRLRAERRVGEMMAAQREAGLMSAGAANAGWKETHVAEKPITLAEAGIDKNLAHAARTAAAIPAEDFEKQVEERREKIASAVARVETDIVVEAKPTPPAKTDKQKADEAYALLKRWSDYLKPIIDDLYGGEDDADWLGYEAFAKKYQPLFAFDAYGTHEVRGREARALRDSIFRAIGEAERQLQDEARVAFDLPDAPPAVEETVTPTQPAPNAYAAAKDGDEPFTPPAFLERGAY